MSEYGLGLKEAQVAATNLIAAKPPEVQEVLEEFDPDVVRFDTPGQFDL